jgi:hypothetical protein
MEDVWEHSNEPSGSVQAENSFDQQSNYKIFKKNLAPSS